MGAIAKFFRPYSDENLPLLFVNSFLILGPNAIFALYLLTRFVPKFGTVTGFAQLATVMSEFVLLLIFTAFIWVATAAYLLDYVLEKLKRYHEGAEALGLGKSIPNAVVSLLIGGAFGAFLVFLSKTSPGFGASVAASISPLNIQFADAQIQFIYTKYFSPVFEEYFFRGVLVPTLIANTVVKSFPAGELGTVVAVVGGAVAFALFHQSATPFLFFFAIAMTVGMYWRKSIAFALGAHLVLNFFLA